MHQTSFSTPSSHPSLPGHFPGRPVVPGVLLLDQVLAVLPDKRGDAIEIEMAKFLAPVLPGQQVDVVWHPTAPDRVGFTCKVGDRTVLHGRIRIAAEPI